MEINSVVIVSLISPKEKIWGQLLLLESKGVTVRGIEQVQFPPCDLVRLTGQALANASEGLIRPIIGQTFALEEAAEAHRAIEARTVIAKTLLVI